jgi:type II secretory pathway pseudopilin PulG
MREVPVMKKNHGDDKGFTLIELLTIIATLGILMAVGMPKLIAMNTDAAKSTAASICEGLRTANTLTFSHRYMHGLLGAYTMGDVAANVQVAGVEEKAVTATSYKVKINSRWYQFDLTAPPDVPVTMPSIIAVTPAVDGSDTAAGGTDVGNDREQNNHHDDHPDWWARLWDLLNKLFGWA